MIGFGRYNLLLKLGQGGMGAVYLARHKTLKRFCALKVINPQFSQDKDAAERFLREARSTASLSHPNLINVFDCDQFDGQYFIAMEYVEGRSLGEILRQCGPLPLPLTLYLFNQAVAGLEYVHNKEITHRDIKPDNMMIDASGALKIMDLGLAKDHFEGDQSMTMTGTVMGSPHYMSPEQINDSKTVDHRTDLYSLGISFYQMLVGSVPFHETSTAAVCVAHLQKPIPSVNFPDAELTQALDGFISKIAAKDKDERFQSASEILECLPSWTSTYPMDEASQEFFSKLGFDDRRVAHLLEKDQIDPTQIDSDLDIASATPAEGIKVSAPIPSNRSSYANLITASVGAIVVLLMIAAFLSTKRKAHSPQPQTTTPKIVRKESSSLTKANNPSIENASPPPASTTSLTSPSTPSSPIAPTPPKLAELYIRTQPEKATVTFRDEPKLSPASFDKIPDGKYSVKVSLPGYEEVNREIEITNGKFQDINIPLKKIYGTAMIKTEPDGAEVIVDGRVLGKTPRSLDGADGETMNVVLRLDGYQEARVPVLLKKDGNDLEPIVLASLSKPKSMDFAHRMNAKNTPFHSSDQNTNHAPNEQRSWSQSNDDSNQGLQPNNYGMDPMEQKRNMRQLMLDLLDQARNVKKDSQWVIEKKKIVEELENKIKDKFPRNERGAKNAAYRVGIILDEARRSAEFESKKESYAIKMMEKMFESVRDGMPFKRQPYN